MPRLALIEAEQGLHDIMHLMAVHQHEDFIAYDELLIRAGQYGFVITHDQ